MEILRYSAFTRQPEGGNPAGVALDASAASEEEMQAVAAEVGYSESAFVTARRVEEGRTRLAVRYYSPEIEVDFCGHATIATAIAHADRHGPGALLFETRAGEIPVEVVQNREVGGGGGLLATLTSVPTRSREVPTADLAEALSALGWREAELDPALPPRIAFGGVDHLVLAAGTRERLAELDYDFERLKALMSARGWITLQLVWRESPRVFHVRDPFPVGGVVEDPATGAAAAAFGGYLRTLGLIDEPTRLILHQGVDMGRPSRLLVDIDPDDPQIRVSGSACPIP